MASLSAMWRWVAVVAVAGGAGWGLAKQDEPRPASFMTTPTTEVVVDCPLNRPADFFDLPCVKRR